MKVVLLGTGTLAPTADRASTALAAVEDGRVLFVDFGRNALNRSVECGLDALAGEEFLITHVHPDHCCELVSLLFARNYLRSKSPPDSERARLRITGPSGIRNLLLDLWKAWSWLEPRYPFEVVEIEGGWTGRRAGFEVEAVEMEHGSTPALGYRVGGEGGSFAFTGDTGPGPHLRTLAAGMDLVVTECGAEAQAPAPGHLSPQDIAEWFSTADMARIPRVVLIHLASGSVAESVREKVGAGFAGEVVVGEDRMEIPVARGEDHG